jgi:hypothetical protein
LTWPRILDSVFVMASYKLHIPAARPRAATFGLGLLTAAAVLTWLLGSQACASNADAPPAPIAIVDANSPAETGIDASTLADAPAAPDTGNPDLLSGLRAGFAREVISPNVVDTWIDSNNNGAYEPNAGDRFIDNNANGNFDAFWMAGFGLGRAAKSVHDPMAAVAAVLDDGKKRIGFVVIDSIGFMYDDVEDVRKRLPAALKIDHLIVVSTHDHEVPDLQGLWGPSTGITGVNQAYLEFVKTKMLSAVSGAVGAMKPAEIRAIERPLSPAGLIADIRDPIVYDPDLRILEVRERGSRAPLGQIVNWANHPEALWGSNTEVTADFPGYVRDGLDRGIVYPDGLKRKGHGGITLYVNGAIGGLMAPTNTLAIKDRFLNQTFTTPSHEKARALGYTVADEALTALETSVTPFDPVGTLGLYVKKVDLPVGNLTLLGAVEILQILKRTVDYQGITPIIHSEVNLLTVGNNSILTIPGEAYPELVNGGIESPAGADFGGAPVEVPAWRSQMPSKPGAIKLVFGLANDSIGYIIPRSQWDTAAPYTYSDTSAPYGEANSTGPETAPRLHQAVTEVCAQAKIAGTP